jgi:hypothetical protein
MSRPHLFEFMDLYCIPQSLRDTQHDILDLALDHPALDYYNTVVRNIEQRLDRESTQSVVELGAGKAPLGQRLAMRCPPNRQLHIEVNDLHPPKDHYRALEQHFPGVLRAVQESVDLMRLPHYRSDQLLVLSASFHHIPPSKRSAVLKALSQYRVIIAEPIEWSVKSVAGNLFVILFSLLAPILQWNKRPGNARRVVWCWLIPVSPFLMVWDSFVSSMRCWTIREWKQELAKAGIALESVEFSRDHGMFISWDPS